MAYSILKLTDGDTTVDLLSKNRGFLLNDWQPQIAPYKGGGIWQNSPLTDGRRLAMRNFDNTDETFELVVSGVCQDEVIDYIRNLTSLLEKATSYWTTSWQHEPVWIEARGPKETETRYALIKGYTLGGLNNPYKQPFYGRIRSTMKDLTLVIARDHWLDHTPGDSHCVNINTLQFWEYSTGVTYAHYHESSDADDMFVMLEGSSGWTVGHNFCGQTVPDSIPMECGVRFPSVTIPQGTKIIRAYLEVMDTTHSDDTYPLYFLITGENVDNALAWGTTTMELYDEYFYRKTSHTSHTTVVYSAADSWHTDKEVHYLYGLEDQVQQIVDRPGWASGNGMAFFVGYELPQGLPAHDTDCRVFASYTDVATYTPPILHIDYVKTVPDDLGRESTCTGKTYVANKHNTAQPTHVKFWDQSNADFKDITIGNLFDGHAPAVGDCIYVGVESAIVPHGPFDSLAFDLIQASTHVTYAWKYCTNAVGPVFTLMTSCFGNMTLGTTGETLVWWSQPSNWVECTIDGVAGWWIQIIVTAIDAGGTGPVAPITQNRNLYSVIVPYVDIDELDVPGDITALGKIRIEGMEIRESVEPLQQNLVVVSGRSKSRGINFSPYLNCSLIQNPLGVVFAASGITADATAPTGWNHTQDITGISTVWVGTGAFSIVGATASEYRGTYHVYLRCKQVHGVAGNIRVRVKMRPATGSATLYSEEKPTLVIDVPHMIDLGIMEFGSGTSLTPEDEVESAQIEIQHWSEVTTNPIHMTYYDLVLMPVDEWAGVYNITLDDWEVAIHDRTALDIDALGTLRMQRAVLRRLFTGLVSGEERFIGEWTRQARGGPFLQANSDQRLWFLFARGTTFKTDFRPKFSIDVYRNSRYLTMRGDS